MRNSQKNLKVRCKIDGCDRLAMYTEKELCQKHYFRIMRNGHPNKIYSSKKERGIKERKLELITPNGYKRIYSDGHTLAKNKWLFEHRFVIYKKYGDKLPPCEICGKAINWGNCHIDHKDENRLNNIESNLRPLCRPCNTGRTERSTIPRYEYNGKMQTVTQLAKIEGVVVCRAQLKRRIGEGMGIEEAMFKNNKTHPKPCISKN